MYILLIGIPASFSSVLISENVIFMYTIYTVQNDSGFKEGNGGIITAERSSFYAT